MTRNPPGGSRDPRIEDPTNLWIIHPAARRLLPRFVAHSISANAVSVGGLVLGTLAATAYYHWNVPALAVIGLVLSVAWLIADGLDGMIARATGTASALGRFLDGLCDHGVFILIYVSIATSIGTAYGWTLACTAGALHALQSNIYEGERARFHRRRDGMPAMVVQPGGNPLQQIYELVSAAVDRASRRFDGVLAGSTAPTRIAEAYTNAAIPPLRLMSLLSANVRVCAIFLACLAGRPQLFWWFEIGPLTLILIAGFAWHRAAEARLVRRFADNHIPIFNPDHVLTKDVTKQ